MRMLIHGDFANAHWVAKTRTLDNRRVYYEHDQFRSLKTELVFIPHSAHATKTDSNKRASRLCRQAGQANHVTFRTEIEDYHQCCPFYSM